MKSEIEAYIQSFGEVVRVIPDGNGEEEREIVAVFDYLAEDLCCEHGFAPQSKAVLKLDEETAKNIWSRDRIVVREIVYSIENVRWNDSGCAVIFLAKA